tara:strand:+ start:1169 stop:1291 length:123 start_codon:yes stop_codon:yes gene_type:complete
MKYNVNLADLCGNKKCQNSQNKQYKGQKTAFTKPMGRFTH